MSEKDLAEFRMLPAEWRQATLVADTPPPGDDAAYLAAVITERDALAEQVAALKAALDNENKQGKKCHAEN